MNKEFKGYSLFNDIEDKELQTRNRAVIMCNIVEQYTQKKLITPRGAALVLGYFQSIPEVERAVVSSKFDTMIKERGYATKSTEKQ